MLLLPERASGKPMLGTLAVNEVYCMDALELLRRLPDASVDMVLTSPPYDNLRQYEGYEWDFESIAKETYRVMKHGGVVVWVVGDATIDGGETLSSMRQAIYFVDQCGFKMHDTMIWHKDGSPSPQKTRYLQTYEYMFVLSKSSSKARNLLNQKVKYGASKSATFRSDKSSPQRFKYGIKNEYRVMDNVWYIPSGYMKTTKDIDAYKHPAMFPEELARRHIQTWTNYGDIVIDYFGGSGTTAKMARANNRNFITCDISQVYCDLIRKRLAQPFTPPLFADADAAS